MLEHCIGKRGEVKIFAKKSFRWNTFRDLYERTLHTADDVKRVATLDLSEFFGFEKRIGKRCFTKVEYRYQRCVTA